MYIIAGLYRGRRLVSPKGPQTRPTAGRLREALFNICQNRIEGAAFLDLFAGSGAMGFEALSRGAQSATFVDSHRESIQSIKANAAHLLVESRAHVLKGDVIPTLAWLEKQGHAFDIIFADPPYGIKDVHSSRLLSEQIVCWIDSHTLLKPGGVLFIEEDFSLQPSLTDLKTLILKDSRKVGPAALQQYIQRQART